MKPPILPFTLRYLLKVYTFGLLFFLVFRLLLLAGQREAMIALPGAGRLLLRALFMGFRFDTVICCYLLCLPALLLYGAEAARFLSRRWLAVVHGVTGLMFILAFFACAADIPFYANYHSRLNATVLNWTATPGFMIKMVLQEQAFRNYLLLFLGITALWLWCWRRLYRQQRLLLDTYRVAPVPVKRLLPVLFLSLGLLFLGIRGRTTIKTPIQVGTAFFSPYNLPNQLGLNPVFTFIRSFLDGRDEQYQRLQLMDDAAAVRLMQDYLKLPQPLPYPAYPLARPVAAADSPERLNVVVVLMESMSAAYLQRYGGTDGLTPVLDRLSSASLCFDRFYASGIHTYNGIFSSLYGLPALMARHSMYHPVLPECTGLPYILKQQGYYNLFYITHDDQFDNIGPFLTVNHFDEIRGQKDFPSSEVISTLGVPDHLFFGHLLQRLDEVAAEGRPFFATAMTGSNHNPFRVPDGIPLRVAAPQSREGCVRYADWSLGEFMRQAATKPWYAGTLFVFLGDHGTIRYDDMYADMSYAYSHIPLLFYRPGRAAQVIGTPGSQQDLCATICGQLGLGYTNNTLGIDLLKEQRPFATFSADDKVAAVDREHIYVWHRDGREQLFRLEGGFTNDILADHRLKGDSMRHFLQANIQSAQWLLSNGRSGPVQH